MKVEDQTVASPFTNIFSNLAVKTNTQSNASTQNTVNKLPQGAKVIGNYLLGIQWISLGKNIGQGTFGKVHLAMHMPTNEKVAVKIIDKSKMR